MELSTTLSPLTGLGGIGAGGAQGLRPGLGSIARDAGFLATAPLRSPPARYPSQAKARFYVAHPWLCFALDGFVLLALPRFLSGQLFVCGAHAASLARLSA